MSVVRFRFSRLRRLALVAVRALERALDQRELDALDVALEVDAVVGKPRLRSLDHGRLVLDLRRQVLDVDLPSAPG